ncbi:hypothetical protein Dimus_014360 [Dionaea muscipula]
MEVVDAPVRVQYLAQNPIPTVPPQYIQPPEHRPKTISTAASTTSDHQRIPVIDLCHLNSSPDEHLRREIGRACRDWGAFQVTNHGVPVQLLEDMRSVGLSFFNDCDASEKLKYSCDQNSAASEGYGTRMLVSKGDDAVLDWRDFFDHHTFPISRRNPSHWPEHPPNYRQVVGEYSNQMKVLAEKLLALISDSLSARSSCIMEAVGEIYQNITVSYYPPCPQPELTLGLQAHSDIGAITLLIQDDTGGLQVHKNGEWVTVEPLSEAIVVLLADQTEIITNGAYRSAQHRAITNANRARLSVATFHDPAKTKKISPASELIGKLSPPKYCEVVYGEYVSSWYTRGPEGKRIIDTLLL